MIRGGEILLNVVWQLFHLNRSEKNCEWKLKLINELEKRDLIFQHESCIEIFVRKAIGHLIINKDLVTGYYFPFMSQINAS